ncbi:hypothetical protein [uncultured Winogradskyella sp.]|uniref:hypothetical protein n=1 Tax=uncultured Winogradskyella sp. TaxID=395353 RepID=UPI00261B4773|nr:hypothetical protein [uncultured Winogradskyella sp.]
MKKLLFVLSVCSFAFLSSCSATRVVQSTGSSVPSGTVVPFSKISNESFAEEYIGADVVVECQLLSQSSAKAQYSTKKMPEGHFAFEVSSEDVDLNQNELTGALEGLVVFAPNSYSDLIFSMKKGDKIKLQGGTLVTKIRGGKLYGLNSRYIHFLATSIEKM